MENLKPIIGVIPLWDDSKDSIWMLPGYMDAIKQAGGIPIIFPLEASPQDIYQLCSMCNGFLFTGGHDVNPALYSQPKSDKCGTPNDKRDYLESGVFNYALENDMPVLGICRGIQLINVLCGGSLYQDLPSEHIHKNKVSHQMTAPYNRSWHTVSIIEGSPLAELSDSLVVGVNSYHHQAIKELSPKLEAMALSEDGLIEAIYMPDKRFIQAVQWHPEFNFFCDELSSKIILSFIQASSSLPEDIR